MIKEGESHPPAPPPTHYPFLVQDEADKLVSLLYNYLSLGQFELGRAILFHLHACHPSKTLALLWNLISSYGFPCNWLTSLAIPSAAHMAWLCASEYIPPHSSPHSSHSPHSHPAHPHPHPAHSHPAHPHPHHSHSSHHPHHGHHDDAETHERRAKGHHRTHSQHEVGLPPTLLRSISYCILLHDTLGDTGDDNMVVEAALNELSLHQQQITSTTPKNVKLSDFALLQLSKIFTLFPLLGRVILKYLEVPLPHLPPHQQHPSAMHPSLWSLHNLYVQIVNDMLGKQLYDEVYGYLQVLHPASHPNEGDLPEKSLDTLSCCKAVMKDIALLCFKQKSQADSKDASRMKGVPHVFKFVPMSSSLMSIDKVFEGFLQSNSIAGLQAFCKEATSLVEDTSQLVNTMPMPFVVVEDGDVKNISLDTHRKFWYWYYHYVSINNVHFLEHTASRALALTSNLQISAANTMVTVFEKLRALVYLMSWDNFNDQVLAKLKLSEVLWENRSPSAGETSLLNTKADQVTFLIKQAWWAVTHLHPELSAQEQQTQGNTIVQELLAELKSHSLPFVVRNSLPTISPVEIVAILQSNPETSPNAAISKDQDSDVLHGYYIIRSILTLFNPATGDSKLLEQHEQTSIVQFIAKELRNVRSVTTRLSLLEVLYLMIFIDSSNLCKASDPSSPTHAAHAMQEHEFMAVLSHSSITHNSSKSTRYLFPPVLIGRLLHTIADSLEDIKISGEAKQDIAMRLDKLSQLNTEALTRHELVTANPERSIDSNSFIAHMTAVPATLLTSSMRAGLTEQCEKIIQFFSLSDHPLSQEALLAKRLAEFEKKAQVDSASNISLSLDTLLSSLPSDAAFTTRTDFAVTTASPAVSASLLAKIEPNAIGSSSITDFIGKLACLSKHFPSSSIRSLLSNIKLLQGLHKNNNAVILESHLSFQKLATSNLQLLHNLVKDPSINKSALGSEAAIMGNMLKIVGGLPGALYLHNFLEHVLALGKALERQEYFSIIAQGPKQIVQELIFKKNLYSKAEELASILKLDIVGIIFSGLFQNNISHQILQPELIRYIGINLPALATLACILRCPDPTVGTNTSIYTKAATDLAQNYPALHTWVRMHTEAKQLFWKTCQSATGTLGDARLETLGSVEALGLDHLPAEEKAIYKLASNVEDIPDAFYSKIVDRLIAGHALEQAVEIADRYLPTGAADWVLRVMAESCDNSANSWIYIRRIKDKTVATVMVLKSYSSWELDVCLDMLFMCKCHLSPQKSGSELTTKATPKTSDTTSPNGNRPQHQSDTQVTQHRETIQHLYNQMQIYKSILTVDPSWNSKWQAIDDTVKRDPVILIRRLLAIKQYVLARKIRELFVVPNIKSEIDESYLLHLLEQNDTSTALQTLMELGEDSIKLVESLSDKIHENYSTKLFLVQFLMGNMSSALSTASYQALSTRETGIKVLLKLPKELQQQYAKLTDYPSLIIESLIMNEMSPQVHRLLSEIPTLRDDDMILKYASKALDYRAKKSDPSPSTPSTPTATNPTSAPSTPITPSTSSATAVPVPPSSTPSTPSGRSLSQPIAISLSSDAMPPPDAAVPSTPSASYSSSYMVSPTPLPPGMTRTPSTTSSRRTRRAKWHLLAPPDDSPVRAAHYFPAAPSISLAKALFDLVGDRRRAGQACLSVCTSLAQRLSAVYSDDNLLIISLIRQLLLYAKLQFMQDPRGGGSDGVATCDTFLGKVELFQELVIAKCTYNTCLEDLSDPQKARHLRDKLIRHDRLKFAIDVATKCNILPDPAWLAWGLSLLSLGKYAEAREKFKYCLASATERRAASSTVTHPHSDMVDPASVLVKIINVLESQPAPHAAYLRYVCDKLMNDPQNAKGGAYYEEMSVDAFIATMQVGAYGKSGTPTKSPATTPTKERPSSVTNPTLKGSTSLDNDRYEEAVYYIRKYGSARGLINFQIRHGKLAEAIATLVSDNIPPNIFHEEMFLPCLTHGNIETLFDVARRSSNNALAKLNPHLTHTCKMLFQAKHYHLLQIVQVFMGDPVRAGLTSIKMYIEHPDAADFEGKLRILEDARRFFQEGLSSKSLVVQGAGAALPDAEISKYAQTTSLQIEVTAFLLTQGKAVPASAYKISLFGPPTQKSEIAELLLVLYNFGLAFKIMQDFRLPITTIYLNAICTMSRKKQSAKVNDLLKEIKGTCSDNDWDEIVLASIKVHVSELQDTKTAEKIASKLVGSRSKVIANILCGKRKAAYLQAVRDNDRELVQMVCKDAEKTNDATIFGLCEKYLSQNSQ